MATKYNNKIVTDGLVLCLDAGDVKSYSGSGSTWTDRSGNSNNGSKVSAPVFSSDNGGVFVFDGTNDGFSFSSVPQVFNGSVTFEGWFYFEDSGVRDILFGSYNESGTKVNFERSSSNNLRLWWNNGTNNIYSSNNTVPSDQWCYVTMIRNKEAGKFQFYVNGELDTEPTVSSADIATVATPFRLGRDTRDGTTCLNGKIGNVKLYSKALTAEEIAQNFNATKDRFGL
jgi:hypothetical protein